MGGFVAYAFPSPFLCLRMSGFLGFGIVPKLTSGSRVLLTPGPIIAVEQAVFCTLQATEHQRRCLIEERVWEGNSASDSSIRWLAVVFHSEGGAALEGLAIDDSRAAYPLW